MLRHARMAAMTGRAAAFGMIAGRRLWAEHDAAPANRLGLLWQA
tara:strand:- start:47 stop:178 length:132 start_codon:yes stop_codon:yes gene_type:complete